MLKNNKVVELSALVLAVSNKKTEDSKRTKKIISSHKETREGGKKDGT